MIPELPVINKTMHKSNLEHLSDVHALAARALHEGAERPKINHLQWNVAGNCESPLEIERYARPSPKAGKFVTIEPGKTKVPFGVDLTVPCRKCVRCLARRRLHWQHRAYAELCGSPRTWFATLTLSPVAQLRFLNLARRFARKQGEDYETYTADEKFGRLCRQVGKEVSLYLARLRKHSAPFRYLVVYERHESGLPHLHALLHETVEGSTTERLLRLQWRVGHSKFKCVDTDPRIASYVAKYLSKEASVRVRASRRYGTIPTYSDRCVAPTPPCVPTPDAPRNTIAEAPDCTLV